MAQEELKERGRDECRDAAPPATAEMKEVENIKKSFHFPAEAWHPPMDGSRVPPSGGFALENWKSLGAFCRRATDLQQGTTLAETRLASLPRTFQAFSGLRVSARWDGWVAASDRPGKSGHLMSSTLSRWGRGPSGMP